LYLLNETNSAIFDFLILYYPIMANELTQQFETAYAQLNTQQQAAVNETEGPVLVIAGPGTGKTQILAARIAHILETTDSQPENILCLTYTDAGAIAMRKRLLKFIGPDSYRVHIYTFHAFCNAVIQDNLDYFGLKGLDAISDLEKIEYVHQIIDGFDKNHPLKRYTGDVYFETGKLLSLYATMKKENWTAEFLETKAVEYINDLPNRDEYVYKRATKTAKTGDLKQADIDKEVKRMNELVAAAKSFDTYQQKLQKNNRYDFDDMIIWVIRAFKDKPDLIHSYREKYLYFLVDEYQDTNGSQNEILEMLLAYWEKPNVFCVGDDDQSIYRFQGANVENIARFVSKYAPKTITLEDNYRSTQYILDASRLLIATNKSRINPNKVLIAKNESLADLTIKPKIRSYHNLAHEIVGIANNIIELQKNGTALNEIAVLYRKHSQAEEIIKYLQSKNIAVNARKRINALEEPFIKKIIHLLKYINAEHRKAHTGEAYIYELLHYDFFYINPIDIARVSVEVYRKNFSERVTSWREALRKASTKKAPDLFSTRVEGEELTKTSKLLEGWIKDAANVTLQQLIENIITQSGMLISALAGEDKTWNMQLLHTFFDFVKEECSRHKKTNISTLLTTIQLMEDEDVDLPVQKIKYAEDGVHFLTAHSSKGLEFEHVFIIGTTTKAWEKSANNFNFKLPDTLFTVNTEDDAEESRRLFYVAMTRAKKQLVLSYAERDYKEKELEKSRFIAELETNAGIEIKQLHVSDEELLNFQITVLNKNINQAAQNLFDNEFVDELLEKYTLSVTHLNNYLKCPTAFYFNSIVRVPAPLSASMTFGSAVHHALEMLFKNMNNSTEKQFATGDQFVNDFKWYMRKHEDSFTEIEFKRRVEYGQEILPKYYDKYINHWNKITSIERSYRNVVMENVPLNGKLDKLEFDGNDVNVVDYKTGQFENAKHKFSAPDLEVLEAKKDSDHKHLFEYEFGGDYWRQAVFYKILMDTDTSRSWDMRSTEFDFVEPDKKTGEYIKQKVNITPGDVEIVKKQIVASYNAIKAKKFNNGCGKADCQWCGFVSDYYSGHSLQDAPKAEAEDSN
jgi:DNA helicase-2/ATP-dependent DNA helicase PcrA